MKSKPKLNRKKVEDGILTYLQNAKATIDMEFGELEIKVHNRGLFNRYKSAFRVFIVNGIHYSQASSDERTMTITYLFH